MKKVFLITVIAILSLVVWWWFGNKTVVEDIGNELEKADLIRLDTPRPNQVIDSPLTIKGEARGTWFFEASFPVVLTDWDGLIIAQGIATAKSDWMTSEFVPFEATLNFTVDKNAYSNRGSLVLRKDNPSGLSEYDDALEIPVVFAGVTESPRACTQEAKLCPDGTYVGRTGPKCEFVCPQSTSGGGIKGKVLLGPICPVMRVPPDPQCADKPYETSLVVTTPDGVQVIKQFSSDARGVFMVDLPPGEYAVRSAAIASIRPYCTSNSIIIVLAGAFTEADVSCDTGIR